MDSDWVRNRITQLRMQNNLAGRELSLSMGKSASFINKIENKRSMPKWDDFFYMCEMLKISPKDFFDDGLENPPLINEVLAELRQLDDESISDILRIAKGLNKNKKRK